MMVQGRCTKVIRWIHAGPCVVRVEVDAIIPDGDPSEPCLAPATVKLLDHLQELANQGRTDELRKYGDVYVHQSA